jgi:hypothetical protein
MSVYSPLCLQSRLQVEILPIGSPDNSVKNYQHKLCNIPEERRPQLHRGGSLKSRNHTVCFRIGTEITRHGIDGSGMSKFQRIIISFFCSHCTNLRISSFYLTYLFPSFPNWPESHQNTHLSYTSALEVNCFEHRAIIGFRMWKLHLSHENGAKLT